MPLIVDFAFTAYYNTGAESDFSNEVSVVPTDQTAPATPAGLTAIPSDGQIELSWAANVDDTVGYRVYYGIASGVYGNSENVGNTTGAIVAGLTNGTTYYFAVTALDAADNESGEATANAVPAP